MRKHPLLNGIQAKPARRHDKESNDRSCFESDTSDSSSSGQAGCEEVACNVTFKGEMCPSFCNSRIVATDCIVYPTTLREERHQKCAELPCMMECCSPKARSTKSLPHYEFGSVAAFIENITIGKASHYMDNPENPTTLGDLNNLISKVVSYTNYDALIPFFYNFDTIRGLSNNVFDTHFANWYISAFSMYINMMAQERLYVVNPQTHALHHLQPNGKMGAEVDFFCMPINNYGYADVGVLFNDIITTTQISPVVIEFTTALLRAAGKTRDGSCDPKHKHETANRKPFTTCNSYKKTMVRALETLLTMLISNQAERKKFVNTNYAFTFAVAPVSLTGLPGPTATVPSTAFLIFKKDDINVDVLANI